MEKVAVLSYNHNKYSETFIANLVKRLPPQVLYLYGGDLPEFFGDGQPFLANTPSGKLSVAIKEFLGTPRRAQLQNKIKKHLIKNRVQAVLANYAITAFPVMDICQQNNIPLIVHFHGWTAYRSNIIEAHRSEYTRMFEIAKAVIVVSNDMKNQVETLGCPPHKINLVHYGPNPDLFKYADRSANKNTFICVGRFCDTKNPHLTILAFSKVLDEIPDAKLVMIGGDEGLLNASVALARALKIESKIEFCNILPATEIAVRMEKALALVQHSATTILSEKEGTPLAILEACATGLPVIATRHAGIKDVITENESGFLCNEFDVDDMAKKMILVAKDRALAGQLGKEAYKRVSENFTMQQYISKVHSVIRQVIDKN